MERPPVERVLDEHGEELMALPGVVGIGIGERDGAPCLRVFVARKTREVTGAIPVKLAGYAVEVEETGEFQAR